MGEFRFTFLVIVSLLSTSAIARDQQTVLHRRHRTTIVDRQYQYEESGSGEASGDDIFTTTTIQEPETTTTTLETTQPNSNVTQLCFADADCNSPFGSCVKDSYGMSTCQCIPTISGRFCRKPWILIVVVVSSFLLLTLAVTCVCYRLNRAGEPRGSISTDQSSLANKTTWDNISMKSLTDSIDDKQGWEFMPCEEDDVDVRPVRLKKITLTNKDYQEFGL